MWFQRHRRRRGCRNSNGNHNGNTYSKGSMDGSGNTLCTRVPGAQTLWRPVASHGAPWSAMKDPSPSLIFTADNGAELWASGIFKGTWQWQRAHNIGCRANCLRHPRHDAIECHVNMDDTGGLQGRIAEALQTVPLHSSGNSRRRGRRTTMRRARRRSRSRTSRSNRMRRRRSPWRLYGVRSSCGVRA